MRKFLLVAIVAFFVLYILFFCVLPSDRHAAEMQAAGNAARARFAEEQSHAEDPQKNGYLAAPFLDFWGIKTVAKEDSSARAIVEAWNKYDDHKSKSPAYLKAKEDFAGLLPGLAEALSKPYFVVPAKQLRYKNPVFNLLAMRSIALALSGYAASQSADGNPAEAARCVALIWELGKHQYGLHESLFDLALLSIGYETCLQNLGPNSELTAAQWLELKRSIEQATPQEDRLKRALETDVALVQNAFQEGVEPADDNADLWLMRTLPGMWSREQRIYDNQMGEVLAGHKPQLGFTWGRWLVGSNGFVADITIPNAKQAGYRIELLRAQLKGLSAYCQVNANRAEHGKLPAQLDLPAGLTWEASQKRLRVKVSPEALEATKLSREQPLPAYVTFDEQGLVFQF